MEKNLYLDFKPHEDISETLSPDVSSLNGLSAEDNSPSNVHSSNSIEVESTSGSKKIRKKRNAYKKIDDDIRLHLLEAVQRGETLKSAAKRYQVNYSSAKSIFHIYRKEGRILKKATQERGFGFEYPGQPGTNPQYYDPHHYPHQSQSQPQYQYQHQQQQPYLQNPNPTRLSSPYPKSIFSQPPQQMDFKLNNNMFHTMEEVSGSSSPLNGLVDNFADLLKLGNNANGNNQMNRDDYLRNKSHMPLQPSRFNPLSTSPTHSLFKPHNSQTPTQSYHFNQMSQSPGNHMNHMQMNQMGQMNSLNQFNRMAQITLASKPSGNGSMMSPSERMKQTDNFYMNYNNSPLSGNGKMIREGSEQGSNRFQHEFDSFSDMLTSFQTNNLTDSIKKSDFSIPKLHVPIPQNQQPQHNPEKMDNKMTDEDPSWAGNIEYAALDTFKSLLDAQVVVSNAWKKASHLNNLVHIQRTNSPSPKFMRFQGN